MRVTIVGSGYAGLVTAIGLARAGHHVTCVDVDEVKVASLRSGDPGIFEPGLESLLRRHLADGRLRATTDLASAVADSEVSFICVGTPSGSEGRIDTSYVERAAEQVADALRGTRGYHVVVVKSTVVPGTTDALVAPIMQRVAADSVGIAVNPEFLTEGQALSDFLEPDRIVIGGDERSLAVLRRLYEPFAGVPIVATTTGTAEMIKYASNAMLATAISFANEIANIGSAVGGVDVAEVMRGVHLSRYLTATEPGTAQLAAFYQAGCGYGGSCLPKDLAALAARGREFGYHARLLEAVSAVNTDQPARLVELVRDELGSLDGRRITVLGLAFKPDTDDVRCSPAFAVIEGLLDAGAQVSAHDPVVGADVVEVFGDRRVNYVGELDVAVKGAEAVVIVTRWPQYAGLPSLVAGANPAPVVIDGRRMLEPDSVDRYRGIGQ